MKKRTAGFTLVEVIVVLVLLAILAALFVPSLVGYIDKAKKSAVISECRLTVAAAQTLYSERYADGGTPTETEITDLAEVKGTVSDVETNAQNAVLHLTYTSDGISVTYCRDYETCPLHDAMYTVDGESGGGSGGSGSDPEPTGGSVSPVPTGADPSPSATGGTNTPSYFYVGGTNYKVETIGDVGSSDFSFGAYGMSIYEGQAFYYQGDYYILRDSNYFRSVNDIVSHISSGNAVKIDTGSMLTVNDLSTAQTLEPNQFTSDNPDKAIVNIQAGDLVYDEATGNIYTYTPYGSASNGYKSPGWFTEAAYTEG